jgi:hypothetical protein
MDWKQGTTVYPIVDWAALAEVATAETVGFLCKARTIKRGTIFGAAVTITAHSSGGIFSGISITPVARALYTARFPEIADATSMKCGEYLHLHFERTVPSVTMVTSAVADVAVLGAGIVYKANTRSGAEAVYGSSAVASAKATA